MTVLAYSKQVWNESGYVLLYPNLNEAADLLQSVTPNPYAESSVQLFPLGTRLIRGLWEFWYCKNAATALSIAVPVQSAAAIHAEADDDIVVGAASAIAATTVTLTSTANLATAPLSTKDGFAEGYLFVNDAAGEGQFYQIKSHEAASGTSNFIVTLYDPLTIALTTSSQVGLIQHPCANVVVAAATVTGVFIGKPLIPITASYFFWALHAGPAPAIANGVVPKGSTAVIGTTEGKVDAAGAHSTEIIIGYPLTPGIGGGGAETFAIMLGT